MNYWNTDIVNKLTGVELKTYLNKRRILKYLYRHGKLSSADLSKVLKISAPKANAYLNELISELYVENYGKGDSIGGRKPNMYGLKKGAAYIIGIDLGLKAFRIGIFNSDLEKVSSIKIPSIVFDNRDKLINMVYAKTIELCQNANIDIQKIVGIGINMPGLIDSDKGVNYTYLFNDNESIANAFFNKFKKTVFVENDSKARTLAEMRYGAAKKYTNALVLQIDWGLGLGMILNGKLFKGKSGFAGEFSHMPIDPDGVLCNCGKIGCLETIASGNALVRYAHESFEVNKQSVLFERFEKNKLSITPELIIKSAMEGDQFSLKLLQKVGLALGKGISYLVQILNPEAVILGGVLASAGQLIEMPVKQEVIQNCLPNLHADCEIKTSNLGVESGIIGSAIVVLENILEKN